MLKLIVTSFISCFLLMSANIIAQVGIGTLVPDDSALLDLFATDKGFLLPRLSTTQRDLIENPANALMIYNNTSNEIQINTGSPESPIWSSVVGNGNSTILSVTNAGDLSTTSTSYELIPGMELTPPAGTYLVLFNGQFGLLASVPVSTEQGVIDLGIGYDALMAITATNTTHALVFGNDEILPPGVYNVAGATSLAGTLFMDGGGDTTSVFIIRSGGALDTGAGTTVVLTNGARARNIFWIAEGALGLGANTTMKGTLISHNAAVSAAAGSNVEGRLFSTTGAIAFGPGTAYIPAGNSYIDFGVLSTFVMFTSSGALSTTEPSFITGDVGTNLGAITGFEQLIGNIYGPGAAPNPTNTSGQTIDIRWHVDTGGVVIGNRIISLIKAN